MEKPRILECTLRDGSYENNFQFTEDDTRQICKALEDVGFDLIEVGHGMGLGASEKGKGIAAETDEVYLRAASESIHKSDWGMFCIPGIAELTHIDLAAQYGMKFIRIGTNIEQYQQAEPFISLAKNHGMFVCANFMKSYVCPPTAFAKYAIEAEKFGADVVYLVDSAGGMLQDEISSYVYAVREQSESLRLGFHGHNNLGLAVANSLQAIELGVEIVDTSLQGFGRGGGNASTEQVLCALMRQGIDMDIDPIAVMDVAEKFIQPMIKSVGLSSIDMISGLALFHSSYMPTIEKISKIHRVDPRKLIVSVCENDRVEAPEEMVDEQARKLSKQGAHGSWKPLYKHYYGGEQN
ncbi:MAG: 4-hydroxy-2-oxovalerate aldolase [Proteobacteria bacterium]|nr:4-hydroxy-2-oxovalerate aldolase [Pseudomonadota bacterium]MBU1709852.1 4-hydroxy-2-oxovalerate aldolase [Pseudomonadota bacterium]